MLMNVFVCSSRLLRIAPAMLVLFTMFCGSYALAVDIDGDGLEASVDFNDYVPATN